jgi:hypothetical protein
LGLGLNTRNGLLKNKFLALYNWAWVKIIIWTFGPLLFIWALKLKGLSLK